MNNVALMLSGQARGVDISLPLIKKNIIDRCDTCSIFIYACKDESTENLINTLDKLNLKPEQLIIEEDKFIQKDCIRPISTGNNSSIERLFQQLYGIYQVNNLRFLSSKNIHDWVIRCRLDLSIKSPLPNLDNLSSSTLYVPESHSNHGINDMFAFSNSDVMNIYCNRFNLINTLNYPGHNSEANLEVLMCELGIPIKLLDIICNREGKTEAYREKSKWETYMKERGVLWKIT